MSEKLPDHFDAMLTEALRSRPERAAGFDLAAEARRRGAGPAVPAGLLRWMKWMRWCSAGGVIVILAILGAGWYEAKGTTASGSADPSQSVFVEMVSTDTPSIGLVGFGVLGVALAGVALAGAFSSPGRRYDGAE